MTGFRTTRPQKNIYLKFRCMRIICCLVFFLFVLTRPFHNRGAFEFQVLLVTGVLCQRHYKGFRQLPLLQPARLALLPLCWGVGKLFCAKTTCLEKQKINELHSSFVISEQSQWRPFWERFLATTLCKSWDTRLVTSLLIGCSENLSRDSKRPVVTSSLKHYSDKTAVNLKAHA